MCFIALADTRPSAQLLPPQVIVKRFPAKRCDGDVCPVLSNEADLRAPPLPPQPCLEWCTIFQHAHAIVFIYSSCKVDPSGQCYSRAAHQCDDFPLLGGVDILAAVGPSARLRALTDVDAAGSHVMQPPMSSGCVQGAEDDHTWPPVDLVWAVPQTILCHFGGFAAYLEWLMSLQSMNRAELIATAEVTCAGIDHEAVGRWVRACAAAAMGICSIPPTVVWTQMTQHGTCSSTYLMTDRCHNESRQRTAASRRASPVSPSAEPRMRGYGIRFPRLAIQCGGSNGAGAISPPRASATDSFTSPGTPFGISLSSEALAVLQACPLEISERTAHRAAQRFPGDLDRAVGEACRIMCSPGEHSARSRSPRVHIPRVRFAGLSLTAVWSRVGPPLANIDSSGDSWLFVPLLLDACRCLAPSAGRQWRSHPLSCAWWEGSVDALCRISIPTHLLLSDLRQAVGVARQGGCLPIMQESQRALLALEEVAQHLGDTSIAHPLSRFIPAVCAVDGYIAAPEQETLLRCFGGTQLCHALSSYAGFFRRSLATASLPTTRPIEGGGVPADSCPAAHHGPTRPLQAGTAGLFPSAASCAAPPVAVGDSSMASGCFPCNLRPAIAAPTVANAIHAGIAPPNQTSLPGHPAAPTNSVVFSGPPVAMPLGVSLSERVTAFWRGRYDWLGQQVAALYAEHLRRDPRDAGALCDLFLDLPVEWPVMPEQYGLTLEQVLDSEVCLFEQRVSEAHGAEPAIADACNTPLNLVKLFPPFMAVLCRFAEKAGIAAEFPFGFLCTLGGWLCHRDVHCKFNPRKPEHDVRHRTFAVIIAETNGGKSGFWKQCVEILFTSVAGKPSLMEAFKELFATPGKKGLYVAKATQGDFAARMHDTGGLLFWASQEAWNVLDTAWSLGKQRVPQSSDKVQYGYLLDTQNGWAYGPCSIKGNPVQYHAPVTNFGMFHAGQPKVIHDFWGAVFTQGCPFSGMGYENRPTFLWAQDQPDDNPEHPQVTFTGATAFMQVLAVTLSALFGQTQEHRNFHESPIYLDAAAAPLWEKVRLSAERAKSDAPSCAKGAIGKHCFTTTSHIMVCHLWSCAFRFVKERRNQARDILRGDTALLQAARSSSLASCERIPAGLVLSAPEHISYMMQSMLVIFNEMRLPLSQRSGGECIAVESAGRRRHRNLEIEPSGPALSPMTADQESLAVLLQRYQDRDVITVTDVNATLTKRSGFRNNQAAICRLFDLAVQHGAGLRVGQPAAPGAGRGGRGQDHLQLRLNLSGVSAASRAMFRLQAIEVSNVPQMRGCGKTRSQAPVRESAPAAMQHGDGLEMLRTHGRPFQFPSSAGSATLQAKELEGALASACPRISSRDRPACALCLAWYFNSDYMWLSLARRGDLAFFKDCCLASQRIEFESVQSIGRANDFDQSCTKFFSALRTEGLPKLQLIHDEAIPHGRAGVHYRGLCFPALAERRAYVAGVADTLGRQFESFTSDIAAALQFAACGPGAKSTSCSLNLRLARFGYRQRLQREAGLLLVCDGFDAIAVHAWAGAPTHESEVVLRSQGARVQFESGSEEDVSEYLASPMACSGVLLPVSDRKRIIQTMMDSRGALCVCVVSADVSTPDRPRTLDASAGRSVVGSAGESLEVSDECAAFHAVPEDAPLPAAATLTRGLGSSAGEPPRLPDDCADAAADDAAVAQAHREPLP